MMMVLQVDDEGVQVDEWLQRRVLMTGLKIITAEEPSSSAAAADEVGLYTMMMPNLPSFGIADVA